MKRLTFLCCFATAVTFMQAQTIHVPLDYTTIQEGINAANPGDTVLVSDGIYFEHINFMGKKPLIVASEFLTDGEWSHIENTIIDGAALAIPDDASVVSFISGEDSTSVLCGFTVRNGRGTIYQEEIFGYICRSGGGVFIKNSGARIIHNHIEQNQLAKVPLGIDVDVFHGGGIGVALLGSTDLVIIEYNTVSYNTCTSFEVEANGAGISAMCPVRITQNVISYNTCAGHLNSTSYAAGICCGTLPEWNQSYKITVDNNIIKHNVVTADANTGATGGAGFQFVSVYFRNNTVISNEASDNQLTTGGIGGVSVYHPFDGCVFSGNAFANNISDAWCGALDFESGEVYSLTSRVLVEGNYFIGNQAVKGGAIACFNVPLCIQNNVFTGNSAVSMGGAILLWKTLTLDFHHMATIMNNSFSENSAANGGALYSVYGKPLVINSIFWNDFASSGAEIYVPYPTDTLEIANSDVDFSRIYGRINDGGLNLNLDPLYEDNKTLMLSENSPCVDAGTSSFTCDCGVKHICPEFDLNGFPRPSKMDYDLGAHEVQFIMSVPSDVTSRSSVTVYPNPTCGLVDFRFSISDGRWVTLKIFDLKGQEVAVVMDQRLSAGEHSVRFDASGLPAGVYCWKLQFGSSKTAEGKLIKF